MVDAVAPIAEIGNLVDDLVDKLGVEPVDVKRAVWDSIHSGNLILTTGRKLVNPTQMTFPGDLGYR